MAFMFPTQLQGERKYKKNLDVKTFLFGSSNRGTQICDSRKRRISKLLSLVQKQLKNIILEIQGQGKLLKTIIQ